MIALRKKEFALIQAHYGDIESGVNLEWLIIRRWPLRGGWNKPSTQVLVIVPPSYPVTPPDNFFTDPDLSLATGQAPGNTSPAVQQLGRPWLQFSYHVESGDWHADAAGLNGHNLLTFLQGVDRRLAEAS